jgi:hypothetical protein
MTETLVGEFACPVGRCHSVERDFVCHHQAGYRGPLPVAKGSRIPGAPAVRIGKAAPTARYVDVVVCTEIVSPEYRQAVRVRGLSWAAAAPFLADHDPSKVVGEFVRFWVERVRWKWVPLEVLFGRARLAPNAWGRAAWRIISRGERPAVSMGAESLREVGPYLLRAEIFEVSVLTTGLRGGIPGARIWSCFESANEEEGTG